MVGTRIDNVFTGVLYPEEDPTHKAAMTKLRSGLLGKWEYYAIVHDKDTWSEEDEAENPEHKAGEKKKSHTHIVVFTKRKIAINTFANALGVAKNYTSYTNDVEGDLDYLTHDGSRGEGKYKYNKEAVETNSKIDYSTRARKEASRDLTDDEKFDAIVDAIDELEKEAYETGVCEVFIGDVMRVVRKQGLGSYLSRNHQFFDKLIGEANKRNQRKRSAIRGFEPLCDDQISPFEQGKV